jgi:hypothetical protein
MFIVVLFVTVKPGNFLNAHQEQVLSGVGTNAREKDAGKGYRRVNMVQILYTHACKWKNETC